MAGTNASYVLRRTGGRPLRFNGKVIACLDDHAEPSFERLRMALYRLDYGAYVTELQCVMATGERPALKAFPWCHAAKADTLNDAINQFESVSAWLDDYHGTMISDSAANTLFHMAGRLCRSTARQAVLQHALGDFLFKICAERNQFPTSIP